MNIVPLCTPFFKHCTVVLINPTTSVLNPLIEIVSHFLSEMVKPILRTISSQIMFSLILSKYGESKREKVLLEQTKLNRLPPVGNPTESVIAAIIVKVEVEGANRCS